MPVTTIRGGRQITDSTIPYADIQNVTANTVLANNTASATSIQEVSLSNSNLLGRGSTGNISAITASTGLEFSGTILQTTANLRSLHGLTFASTSFVKMTGANTFALDTNSYVASTGTPLVNQLAIWTNSTTVQGLASLTYNGTSFIQGAGGNESVTKTVSSWTRSRSTTSNQVWSFTGANGVSGGSATLNAGDTIRFSAGDGNSGAGGNGGDIELIPGGGFVGQANARGGVVSIFKGGGSYTFPTTSFTPSLYIKSRTSNNSAPSSVLRVISETTSPAVGSGVSIEFESLAQVSNYEIGNIIESVSTNVGSGTEAYDLVIKGMNAGAAAAERLRIISTGQLKLTAYTSSSSFTGTAAGYLAFDSSGNVLTVAVPSSGTSYWASVPGTPTRSSNTVFTITDTSNTNKYDLLLSRKTVLKWTDSGSVKMAMIVSATYATNTVTITIIGDVLNSTATMNTFQYAFQKADKVTFAVAGTTAIDTNVSRKFKADCTLKIFGADVLHGTAGTTNSTTYDLNKNGTTMFSTKPSVSSGATVGNGFTANDGTSLALDDVVTLDIDGISTTPAIDAYVDLFIFPLNNQYYS